MQLTIESFGKGCEAGSCRNHASQESRFLPQSPREPDGITSFDIKEYHPERTSHTYSPVRLSLDEGKEWAKKRLKVVPSPFTSMSFFRGVEFIGRSKKGARSEIIGFLRRQGLIKVAGCTTQDQECRNKGYATLWRRC